MPIEDFSLIDDETRCETTQHKFAIGKPHSTITCHKEVESRDLIITRGPMRPSIEGRRNQREVARDNHPSGFNTTKRHVE